MKKTNIILSTLLLFVLQINVKAQSQSPAMKFWDMIMVPYNTASDMSYNLSVDIIHTSPATRQQLLTNIDALDKTTKDALKVYANMPNDMLPEYEKLRKNASLALKTMRVLLDFDNMKAQELAVSANLTAREVLQRMKQSEQLSKRLDSIQSSFYKDIQSYAAANKIKIMEGDTATANEKKRVVEVLGYSSELYKIYLESKIPFEDFLNFMKLEDSTALSKAQKELNTLVQAKMKQLDSKRATKSKDALFIDLEQVLKNLKAFSEKPSSQVITLLTTPAEKRTQAIVDNFNAIIKDLNSIYLPNVNGFNQKYSEYKQKNVKPRKSKIPVVSSE